MPNLLDETPGLIAFVRTAESGSFSSAAKLLKGSPSAVSRSVGRLEKLVGYRLFLRSTRALTLTAGGQALFDRIVPLLRQLDTSEDHTHERVGLRGRIKFSMPGELARFFLTPIFRDFAPLYPEVKLEVGLSDKQVDLIRDDYDIVFRVGGSAPGELMVKKLSDVRMVIVASPGFVDRYGIPRSRQEASALPFARYAVHGKPSPIYFKDGGSIEPNGRVDCDTGQALRAAALHGLGAAYFMRCAVHEELANGQLVDISSGLGLPTQPFSVVHAFGNMMPTRLRRFCEFIEKHTKCVPEL